MQMSKSSVVHFHGAEGIFTSVLTCLKVYWAGDICEFLAVFIRATRKIGSSEKSLGTSLWRWPIVHYDCCRLLNNLIYTQKKEYYIAEKVGLNGLNTSGSSLLIIWNILWLQWWRSPLRIKKIFMSFKTTLTTNTVFFFPCKQFFFLSFADLVHLTETLMRWHSLEWISLFA